MNLYKGSTNYYFHSGHISGLGLEGSNITRLDLGISYNLLKPKHILYIRPEAILGLQFTKKVRDYWGENYPLNGPYYFQTEVPYSVVKNRSFQFVPSAGISIGLKVAKIIDLSFKFQGVYGFKSYQKIYLKYEYYLDNPRIERQAVFETTGTALFRSLNLGLDFGALKKRKLKKENRIIDIKFN